MDFFTQKEIEKIHKNRIEYRGDEETLADITATMNILIVTVNEYKHKPTEDIINRLADVKIMLGVLEVLVGLDFPDTTYKIKNCKDKKLRSIKNRLNTCDWISW